MSNDEMIYMFLQQTNKVRKANTNTSNNSNMFVNLCGKKNLGTFIVRVVPDVDGIPFNIIYKSKEIWLPKIDDTGNLNFKEKFPFIHPHIDNYSTQLTPDEEGLHAEVGRQLDQLKIMDQENFNYYERPELVYFYGKVARMVSAEGNTNPEWTGKEGLVLFRHHSRMFFTAVTNSIEHKRTTTGGTTFLSNYITRDKAPIRNMVAIATTNPPNKIGYSVSFSFETFEATEGIGLSDKDLELATKLKSEFPNVDKFPSEEYEKVLKILKLGTARLQSQSRGNLGATSTGVQNNVGSNWNINDRNCGGNFTSNSDNNAFGGNGNFNL